MTEFVTIHEVGPRDGLQNEALPIATAAKVALIDLLATSGLRHVEIGSFVSPKWVPQMADTPHVMAAIARAPVQFALLAPNLKGWEGFRQSRRDGFDYQIAVFISASEGFSQSNLNCSVAQSVERIAPVVAAAQNAGVAVRGYVSCVTDCPFDGPVAPSDVSSAVKLLRQLAPMQVSLGDTIGKGTPRSVAAMLDDVLQNAPANALAGHFHDTGGMALDNISVSLDLGLRAFDSAVGGLGGCPYAPGAPGNVDTGEVIAMLHDRGFETGIDENIIAKAAEMAKGMRS